MITALVTLSVDLNVHYYFRQLGLPTNSDEYIPRGLILVLRHQAQIERLTHPSCGLCIA
jgi:hypothetical protein